MNGNAERYALSMAMLNANIRVLIALPPSSTEEERVVRFENGSTVEYKKQDEEFQGERLTIFYVDELVEPPKAE